MRLTVVGCSGSMPGPTSAASCYLVQTEQVGEEPETSLLLDLGSGAFGPLQALTAPSRLDAVVLSHLHPDHCADLTALEVWLRYGPDPADRPMRIIGPQGLRERILELTHLEPEILERTFALEIVAPGDTVRVGAVTLEVHEALHPVPALCFTLTGPSQVHDGAARLAYTGDTDLCPGVEDAARGVDLLLAEAAFTSEEEVRGIHLTGGRAGTLARTSGAAALTLTHLQPWADVEVIRASAVAAFGGDVTMATPRAVFEV